MMNVINEDEVDLDLLKVYAFSGVPGQDEQFKGLRPLVWRLILGCLPQKTSEWSSTLDSNLENYEGFKRELIVKPKLQDEEEKQKQQQAMIDHPLSTAQTSVWNTFFKDQEIWDEIEKDVKRTRTDMYYFYLAIDAEKNKSPEDLARLER